MAIKNISGGHRVPKMQLFRASQTEPENADVDPEPEPAPKKKSSAMPLLAGAAVLLLVMAKK